MTTEKTGRGLKRPDFSRNMQPAFRDRGLGHGDYGVFSEDDCLLAEVKSVDLNGAPLPARANTLLFAAAPDLFDACEAALEALRKAGGHRKAISQIRAALKKAVPAD